MKLESPKTDIRSIALLLLILGGILFLGTLLAGADADKASKISAPSVIPAKITTPVHHTQDK